MLLGFNSPAAPVRGMLTADRISELRDQQRFARIAVSPPDSGLWKIRWQIDGVGMNPFVASPAMALAKPSIEFPHHIFDRGVSVFGFFGNDHNRSIDLYYPTRRKQSLRFAIELHSEFDPNPNDASVVPDQSAGLFGDEGFQRLGQIQSVASHNEVVFRRIHCILFSILLLFLRTATHPLGSSRYLGGTRFGKIQ